MMAAIPHWKSFKDNLLPMISKQRLGGVTAKEAYDASLQIMQFPDFYEFQELPFAKWASLFYEALISQRVTDQPRAYQQYRLLMEEAYSVMCFEAEGCRVIKPSAALIEMLMHTDATFPLVDVRPPWPHVYIEFPKGSDLMVQDYYDPSLIRDANGCYVTWAKTGPASEVAKQEMLKNGFAMAADRSRIMIDDLPTVQDPQNPKQMTRDEMLSSMFGDWAARFLMDTTDDADKHIHHRTVKYWNMHWSNLNTDDAAVAYSRCKEMWAKTSKGLEAVEDDADTRCRAYDLIVNLFIYMSLPDSARDIIWKPDPDRERLRNAGSSWNSKRRRNLKNRLREEMRTEEWLVGQTIVIDRRNGSVDTDPATPEGDNRPVRTHWRRGHYQRYHIGLNREETIRKWKQPILVMGVGPVPETTTVIVR